MKGPVLLLACFVTSNADVEMQRIQELKDAKWCIEIVPCEKAELWIKIATTHSTKETFVIGGCSK